MADKSFADYVKDLMGVLPTVNGNPMLSVASMTDENARYREDPFYISRQRQADQLALDEAERARLAAQSGAGMMASGNNGDSSGGVPLSKEQNQFFDWMEQTPEGQAFKDQRGGALSNLIGMVAPGASLFNVAKGFMGQQPNFSSLYNTPQSFYDWQAQQQQSDPAYIADSIARVKAEALNTPNPYSVYDNSNTFRGSDTSGDSAMTSDWTSSDWASDYTSEFGG
jgi:hypothetical protein